ncbi:glutamine synthetase family protein [Biformimicrobium ophioploci]|uniref:Glutamine synthetase family protein n=1 Tax=Biformimicrobium ophioploci TaxID=3036711 RepID=A0ABQ6M2D1_9GAMM|nr:glutamine synthetase family protein [Microbulbifer sp. NKW57]GMG88444.1 glutamine synthetase family protein [Microbulbifer sp. NKW57]
MSQKSVKPLSCPEEIARQSLQFLDENPDLVWVEAFVFDLNGVPRGKLVPVESARKLFSAGLQLPRSALSLDIWGRDVEDSPLVFASGDSDGVCLPVSPLTHAPWHDEPTAQVQLQMVEPDGSPFFGDPRGLLESVCARFKKLGMTPVAATELEFYLLQDESDDNGYPIPVAQSETGIVPATDVYDLSAVNEQREFFDDVRRACEMQEIPADTILKECAPGQYEINLNHTDNLVEIADKTLLFKRILKGVARSHNMRVSTMAKPFGDLAGSGMHVHLSLVDESGKNLFDNGTVEGSDLLRHAVAGMMATANDSMAIFAPHSNSYRRFQESSHAPLGIAWGYDNRTTALRIPASPPAARRFEHRISGSDANPYLVLAAILAGVLHGIENKLLPPEPVKGDAYQVESEMLVNTWSGANRRFEQSDVWHKYFPEKFTSLYQLLKAQEFREISMRITDVEYQSYLNRV